MNASTDRDAILARESMSLMRCGCRKGTLTTLVIVVPPRLQLLVLCTCGASWTWGEP